MKLLIITGMSGAGKSLVANDLEDMGFYCVDNIPPAIIPAFVSLSERSGNDELNQIAVVTDVRGGEMFEEMPEILDKLRQNNVDYKILFLDANDDVIANRYRENRRMHPLCDENGMSIEEAIELEREKLSAIRAMSDFVLDTSTLSIADLKSTLSSMILENTADGLLILCKSFGFKYGIDSEADLVFDARCLPNPFYIEFLKTKTGLDEDVRNFVLGFEDSQAFKKRITDFLDTSIPLYFKEGKSRLVISFGCTGGKHRSVTFAEIISKYLEEKGYKVKTVHRDIKK